MISAPNVIHHSLFPPAAACEITYFPPFITSLFSVHHLLLGNHIIMLSIQHCLGFPLLFPGTIPSRHYSANSALDLLICPNCLKDVLHKVSKSESKLVPFLRVLIYTLSMISDDAHHMVLECIT